MNLILFDFDGTLLNSLNPIEEAVKRLCATHQLVIPALEKIREGVGLPRREALQTFLPGHPYERYEEFERTFTEHMDSVKLALDYKIPLFVGAEDLLQKLLEHGKTLGLVTSMGRRGLLEILNAFKITSFFTTIQTPDDGPGKPAPDPIWNAMDVVGAEAARTCMIGDTIYDIQAGKAAGVTTIAVTWGNHEKPRLQEAGPDHMVNSLKELEALLLDNETVLSKRHSAKN